MIKDLDIRWIDWLFIVLTGTIIGGINGYLIYSLQSMSLIDGVLFGLITGFLISLISSIFITVLNRVVLPIFSRKYWYPSAFLFSFISGFSGTIFAFYISIFFDIKVISIYKTDLFSIATILGFLTYLIGLILYFLIVVRTEKEKLNSLLIESRLKSLEGQLNPHFIFNSLNSISELIHIDKDLAENSIVKLSKFLRDGMREESQIKLSDELSIVRNYLWLENIRFNSRISLKEIINDNRYLKLMIPKFSIQLLVENSIKHSFSKLKSNSNFDIEIGVSKGKNSLMEIYVANSGDNIENLKFGIGLSNLESRLSILNRGSLKYSYRDRKIYFTIYLKELNENINR